MYIGQMIPKTVILLSIFIFSACHPQIKENICLISTDAVLSCIASYADLSTKEVSSKFDSLTKSIKQKPNTAQLNNLLCLSLHSRASIDHLIMGKDILTTNLGKSECSQKNLSGLLYIIRGKIESHKKYLNKNWTFYLDKKKSNKAQETVQLQLDNQMFSYQRRIQDLEQQVQKLKEIESMLDKKTTQQLNTPQ